MKDVKLPGIGIVNGVKWFPPIPKDNKTIEQIINELKTKETK
jgi:hypothetical protein